ncbi:MAG: toxin HicA [Candidatus Omnitrophica bacterium]|nr:toxin HicA [Candidatus Omnitrophota bacterium]
MDDKKIRDIVDTMKRQPQNVRFSDLGKVCDYYFGEPRQKGTSHCIYKMPWPGDPRVNIQSDKGTGKAYQVKQVLAAIKKLEEGKK